MRAITMAGTDLPRRAGPRAGAANRAGAKGSRSRRTWRRLVAAMASGAMWLAASALPALAAVPAPGGIAAA
ncbi:MAG: hypothetical protein ACK5X3_06695, partial [Pseudomonadota bacterium]